jgi:hypothetical protein
VVRTSRQAFADFFPLPRQKKKRAGSIRLVWSLVGMALFVQEFAFPLAKGSSMRFTLVPALTLVVLAIPLRAEDRKDPSKSNLPLQAKLVAKSSTYKLGTDPTELKKQIEEAMKKGGRLPPPPVVDLVLEITNRTDKPVEFWQTGDPVTVSLELKGPGARSVPGQRFFTREFRLPRPMTLAPGKTYQIPLKRLQHGFRGVGQNTYWTEPGGYTLSASFNTAIKPAPKGVKTGADGFGRVSLKSNPVTIKVTK